MRRLSSLTLVIFYLAGPAAPGEAADRRPNVLFIAVDDLNDWVGCLGGHPQVRTPNIDRLAGGARSSRTRIARRPLCNPSRSSLLTGLRPTTTGIYALEPGIRAVPALKDRSRCRSTLPPTATARSPPARSFTTGRSLRRIGPASSRSGARRPDRRSAAKSSSRRPTTSPRWTGVSSPNRDEEQADWKIADSAIAQLEQYRQGQTVLHRRRLPLCRTCRVSRLRSGSTSTRRSRSCCPRSGTTTATTCRPSRGSCTGTCPSRGSRG